MRIYVGHLSINAVFQHALENECSLEKRYVVKLKKNHYRTLKVIYQSEEYYKNLLLESSSVSVHQRHLRFLATEIYKSKIQINT